MPTVKMTKAPPPFTSVEDPETGQRFALDVAVEGVDQAVADRLSTLEGFEFEGAAAVSSPGSFTGSNGGDLR